jgi:hypothetical protein
LDDTLLVVALAAEPWESAVAYAEGHGWEAEVWVVESGGLNGAEAALMGRTPWLFLLSPEGVILAEGHGEELPRIAQPMGWGSRSAVVPPGGGSS